MRSVSMLELCFLVAAQALSMDEVLGLVTPFSLRAFDAMAAS